jgi:hypothetical protein
MNLPLNRREFVRGGMFAAAVSGLDGAPADAPAGRRPVTFSLEGNRVRLNCPGLDRAFSTVMIADTHLFRDDERGEPFRQFSGRMAKAYNQTKHFQTGAATNPELGFIGALEAAAKAKAEFLALVGDIVSFPSEAAVGWARDQVRAAGLPWLYTAGNHDWHYEGMEGSLDSLRATWCQRRLAPLYPGEARLMSVDELHGVRLVALDNSTNEILPEQLKFFRSQVATGKPLVLFVHIPFYVAGRSLGFGCGHPDWGAHSDKGYELERRVKWRQGGHTQVTLDFHREVFAAPNLLGVFAGHTHRASLDVVNGIPQFVTDANATGAFLQLDFVPA